MPSKRKRQNLELDPLWYKDAIIYELHIKSFHDKSGDGIGDFRGLIDKLDYLEDLGVNAIWLLPFYPSPQRDDGYDISDYFSINPDYGTKRDFRRFLNEAHKRDIRVITELVINHTSDQHPWFKRAKRSSAGSVYRDFYVWSDSPDKYSDARIIFQDFEHSNWTWDPEAKSYYWHRFYHHQPDLNYDNPRVQKEIFRMLDYWFEMGIDGLRLDAIPYLFERDGTNCENLPETHDFLKKLRAHIDENFSNRMLLAEANQWPEDAAAYFGDGDECHMAFHFPVMPRLFMALRMEDRFPVVDILEQTSTVPDNCQWAMFLRNHDELTLEMVTDEERDYMHKSYAEDPRSRINMGIRRRLAPLLGNNRRKIELMNMLLLSLPGTPVIYYGDEIGMGDNYYLGDRDGVRTPMQWSPDRNAGFSKANPHSLYLPVIIDSEYHFAAVNVENQHKNYSSLLWWMKRLIGVRKKFKAFGRGSIKFLLPENPKIISFVREYGEEKILIVANLSRFCQMVNLNLSEYSGFVPEELFSSNKFPQISNSPYTLTLGPHSFYWFSLEEAPETSGLVKEEKHPEISSRASWRNLAGGAAKRSLEKALVRYISGCRWFAGKGKRIRNLVIINSSSASDSVDSAILLLLKVSYVQGEDEMYIMPAAFGTGENALKVIKEHPEGLIAHLSVREGEGFLYEAIYEESFRNDLLELVIRNSGVKSGRKQVIGYKSRKLKAILGDEKPPLQSRVLKTEQSNTSLIYSDKLFMKLYRKIEPGVNPDVELNEALSSSVSSIEDMFPAFGGHLKWRHTSEGDLTIGMVQKLASIQSDGWQYTIDSVGRYVSLSKVKEEDPPELSSVFEEGMGVEIDELPEQFLDMTDVMYLNMISLLGRRTAQMHVRLAELSAGDDKAFRAEAFSRLYQRSVAQSMSSLTRKVFRQFRNNMDSLSESLLPDAKKLIRQEKNILSRFQKFTKNKIDAQKIRIHGDYHLGQVLFTGKDFIIIDFEGEPARALSERRIKRSALRDVAGMIKSFQYAAYYTLYFENSEADREMLEPWMSLWYKAVTGVFMSGYLPEVSGVNFLPANKSDFKMLLDAFILDKAVYELGYELNNRPEWIVIPMAGIKDVLGRKRQ